MESDPKPAPRHMGRIVDPDVEDGDDEPIEVEVAAVARDQALPFPVPPPPPPDGTALFGDDPSLDAAGGASGSPAPATVEQHPRAASIVPRPNEFNLPDPEQDAAPDDARGLGTADGAAPVAAVTQSTAFDPGAPIGSSGHVDDDVDSLEISFHTSAALPAVAARPAAADTSAADAFGTAPADLAAAAGETAEDAAPPARRPSEQPPAPGAVHGGFIQDQESRARDSNPDRSARPSARSRDRSSEEVAGPTTRRSGFDLSSDGFVDALNDDQRDSTSLLRTGHPVRDRLLAKAAQAHAKVVAKKASADDPFVGRGLEVVSSELDEIAAPRVGSGSAPLRIAGTTLSSSSLLIFGSLCGVAVVVSLFTLLIQFAPRDQAAPALGMATPQGEAAPPVAEQPPEPAQVAPTPERRKVPGPWRIGAAGPGERKIKGSIGRDPFLKAIQEAGISKNQAYRIYAALKEEKNLDRCRPKDDFIALLQGERVVAFEYVVSKEEVYQAREDKQGRLVGKQLDLQVERQRVQGSLTILTANFADAARAAKLEPELGRVLNRALEGHTSVAQFQRGDRLRVVAQEVTVLGEFYRYAGLEALEYIPANGSPLRIYYFSKKKKYYDAKGRAPGEGGWARPVKGAPITSKFNPQRLHPILKKRMPHNGTDFGAPTGTPIYASSYGTITKRGDYGPNGNFIAIQHEHGYETGYSHLSRFEEGLGVGDKVKRAQVIGYVGSTGRSTGPHLHFSAKKNGAYIDPETLQFDALSVLPPEDRADFAKVRAQYDEMLEAVALPAPLTTEPTPSAPSAAPSLDMDMVEEGADHDMAEMDDSAETPSSNDTPPAANAAPSPATPKPVVPAVATTTVAAPAVRAVGASLYLSDEELMKSQTATDEGEVEE